MPPFLLSFFPLEEATLMLQYQKSGGMVATILLSEF